MAQRIGIAAPGAQEMTRTLTGLAGSAATGVLEGVLIKMAPRLGTLEVPFTWATLLGTPLLGVAGALFTDGMLGDLFQGIAAGSTAIAGYVLPAMLMPEEATARRIPSQIGSIKQLPAGNLATAAQRAQRAAVGLEF